jgi:ribosomal protein L32
VHHSTCRRKAPTITATGCPTCDALGIPGTVCAGCVRVTHQEAIERVRHARAEALARYGERCDVATMMRQEHDRVLAGWAGAELLLDYFGAEPALWRVGFEVP